MLNLDEIWLAEFSPGQGCFHVETAERACEINVQQIVTGQATGYIPFAVCSSHAEASRACDVLRVELEKRGGRPKVSPAVPVQARALAAIGDYQRGRKGRVSR